MGLLRFKYLNYVPIIPNLRCFCSHPQHVAVVVQLTQHLAQCASSVGSVGRRRGFPWMPTKLPHGSGHAITSYQNLGRPGSQPKGAGFPEP
jgi:hypothetical protein